MKQEEKIKVFDTVNEWLKFSDSKSGAIVAFNFAMLGFLITRLESFSFKNFSECEVVLLVIVLIIGCCSNLASLVLAVLSILPSLNSGETESNIFFGHIAQKSKESFIKKINEGTDSYSFDQDLETQIYTNSKIAWKKYKYIYWAIISGLIGFVAEVIFIGILLFVHRN